MFCDQNMAKYKKKHPKMSQQELNRLMAKDFSSLSDKKKKIYSAMAEKAKSKSQAKLEKSPKDKPIATKPETSKTTKAAAKAAPPAVKSPTKPSSKATAKTASPVKPKTPVKIETKSSASDNIQVLFKNEPEKPAE